MKLLTALLLMALPYLAAAQKQPLDQAQLLHDVRVLSADSMEGRLSGSKGSKMAQAYILGRFRQLGLKPYGQGYTQHFKIENDKNPVVQATNLIAYLPGSTAKAIVITAHYDHVGIQKGEVYNGADDNASGVGALLAIADYFARHKPQHTLIFAVLDGEEMGLQGANAFLENPPVPLHQLLLNVNMDMLSINDKGELYASGTSHYPSLVPFLRQVKALPQARLVLGHDLPEQGHDDWTSQSDHFQFHKRGIPYVYFGVEDHPHYHQPSDTYAQVNKAFYPAAAALVLDFVRIMDKKASLLPVRQ
ncbi:M28 family peptidase [Pontibacter sp. E15-1]|uniref:M28 family peptidase n=1 Tax=Pontibacter sp. E15-1 TaxID=2919918 RepID=UPI001F4F1F62|nr:M28 family peptidase [Pontibacter sp. E15-1]MCJ8166697.1 M28 family peptidase [Pontibacter sp. E15-1]